MPRLEVQHELAFGFESVRKHRRRAVIGAPDAGGRASSIKAREVRATTARSVVSNTTVHAIHIRLPEFLKSVSPR